MIISIVTIFIIIIIYNINMRLNHECHWTIMMYTSCIVIIIMIIIIIILVIIIIIILLLFFFIKNYY